MKMKVHLILYNMSHSPR